MWDFVMEKSGAVAAPEINGDYFSKQQSPIWFFCNGDAVNFLSFPFIPSIPRLFNLCGKFKA
jgi:hypothetical protein